MRSTYRATAVFSPENEKPSAGSLAPMSGRGKGTAAGSPLRAALSMDGPPGYGRPMSRATLSNASPAASSRVSDRCTIGVRTRSRTNSSEVWPPDTIRADRAVGQRAVLERVGGGVPGQVVHAVERHAEAERERLRRRDADMQRGGQAGPGGDGDRTDVGEGDAGVRDRFAHGGKHRLHVGAGRDLGHDAAEAGVLVHARGEGVAEQHAVLDETDAGLVARGLDAHHDRHGSALRMTIASTRPCS